MAKTLSRLDILLFANTAQYRREMKNTQKETKTLMGEMKKDIKTMAKSGATAFAALGIAGAAGLAVITKEQVALANEMTNLSRVANTSVQEMQKMAAGAKTVGIEHAKLADIYKDTQDKVGDFLQTGGGAMADFFENIAPQVELTAGAFRDLSGPDALELYYDSLEEANVAQSEMVFYMEAIAGDAVNLIPLLADGGKGFEMWAKAAENAGAIMDEKTLRAAQELQTTTDLLNLSVEGAKNQMMQGFMPVLADVAGELTKNAQAAELAKQAGYALAEGLKFTIKVGYAVVTAFKMVGATIGGVAASVGTLLDGISLSDNAFVTALKLAENTKAAGGIVLDTFNEVGDMWQGAYDFDAKINKLGSGIHNQTIRDLTDMRIAAAGYRKELGLTGKQYQTNAKAQANADKKNPNQKAYKQYFNDDMAHAILWGAKQLGINANDLASVISFETAGTFSTNARNPKSSATGLIQFMDSSDGNRDNKYYGMTRNEFGGLSPQEQMQYVVKYFLGKGLTQGASLGQIYDAVTGTGYKKGSSAYALNKVWDANRDGYIAPGESVKSGAFKAHTKQYFANADAVYMPDIAKEFEIQQALEKKQAEMRAQLRYDYADKAKQIELDLQKDIAKIKSASFEDTDEKLFIENATEKADKALAKLTLQHDKAIQDAIAYRQTAAEQITAQYALEKREIELTVTQDEALRTAKIEALNNAEQQALEELRLAHEHELVSLSDYGLTQVEKVRNEYARQQQAIDQRTDINTAQKADLRSALMGRQAYAIEQIQQPALAAYNRQESELNGNSELYQLQQQFNSRYQVIDNALKSEAILQDQYNQSRLKAEQEFNTAKMNLAFNSIQEQAANVTGVLRMALGEQHTLYKIAFAGQKAIAVAQAVINIPQAYSKAFDAVVGIPYVGPALAPVAGATAAGLQVAQKALIEQVPEPSLPGFQTGGYTGRGAVNELAGLVHKEEFVTTAPTTAKYRSELEAMHDGTYDNKYKKAAHLVNVNIINKSGAEVIETQERDGTITIEIVDKMIKQSWRELSNPNSLQSKQIQRHTTARVARA